VPLAAVVSVKAAPLERDPDVAEHLSQVATALWAFGEGVILERLHDLEVLST
jgi:hypothetical protein